MTTATKGYFETEERRQKYLSDWRETTFQNIIQANRDKSKLDCLQLLIEKLQKIQKGLGKTPATNVPCADAIWS
jgi:uncharacterized protein YaaR (DUF327 family)